MIRVKRALSPLSVGAFAGLSHFFTLARSLNSSLPFVNRAPWAENSSARPVSPAAPFVVRYS